MQTKECSKCKQVKPVLDFFKDKGFKDGYYSRCKKCKTDSTYEWRKNNPKVYNALAVKWRDKNPDKQHATDIKRHYGITATDYNKMLEEQNNGCKICSKQHNKAVKRGRLYVDHCHMTGKVRGLLCGACNSALGYFDDDTDTMEKAIDYLKFHQN